MATETNEDFAIAKKQQSILNELKAMRLDELIELARKYPSTEKEFREGAGFIIGGIYDQELLECLPDSITETLKENLIEILFNKIWSGEIKCQI